MSTDAKPAIDSDPQSVSNAAQDSTDAAGPGKSSSDQALHQAPPAHPAADQKVAPTSPENTQPTDDTAYAPQKATTAGPEPTTSTTTGAAAGDKPGGLIKSLFRTIHGFGEVIRGSFTSAVDGAGERVAGRGVGASSNADNATNPSVTAGREVAQKGQAEVEEGMKGLKKVFSRNKGSSAAAQDVRTETPGVDKTQEVRTGTPGGDKTGSTT